MAKSTKPIRHGTRYGYNMQGCRCEACTKANSAQAWAKYHVKAWDSGVMESLANAATFVGNDITIPSRLVVAAIRRYENKIKMEALKLYRKENPT